MRQRIGVLGGTFDPPHLGHLWLAESAKAQLNLDCVLFLPVGQPPHKQKAQYTNLSHRLVMTKLAIQDNLNFVLDKSDIERPLPHTTATLLPLIQNNHPNADLWLVIGADSLRDFPSWSRPRKIIEQCRLAVLGRPGVTIDWDDLNTAVPGSKQATDFLAGPTMAISSTEIREWAAAGHSLRYLVYPAVAEYINEYQVYK